MPDTWRDIVARKVAEREARIPASWRLQTPPVDLDNVLNIPRECGLLSADELRLTEKYDATALLSGLTTGLLRSVDVTTAFCKRSAIAQQCCNCLTEIFYEDALKRARELDETFARTGKPVGPLHGLPISLKETFKVKGYDASIGYASLCFQPAKENSALVDLLLELGAVIYCKTNVPQAVAALDSFNNVFGRTLNPRNVKLTAGGSSGGEGALLAMRGSILGVGTDVAGSIRIPSMCNQLYGVKPSHGRVPYSGQESGSPAGANRLGIEATAGPMATTMRDCELFMQIICDSMPATVDPDIIPQTWASQSPLACGELPTMISPLRVGIVRSDGHVAPLPPIKQMMDDVSRALSKVGPQVEVIELDVSKFGILSLKTINNIMSIDGGNSYLDHLERTGEPLSPWSSTRIRRRPQKTLDQVREIQAQRTELMKQFGRLWHHRGGFWTPHSSTTQKQALDIIICPNAPHPVPPIDRWNTTNYSAMWNIVDYPCGVLPIRVMTEKDLQGEVPSSKPLNSWDAKNRELWEKIDRTVYLGSPLNIQVVAPRLMERQLVEAMTILDEILEPLREARGIQSKL